MAILIKADGTEEVVKPANGRSFTLEEAQGYVGGYVQMIETEDHRILMNEDGKHLSLPSNARATARVAGILFHGDYLVGDVLFCLPEEFE